MKRIVLTSLVFCMCFTSVLFAQVEKEAEQKNAKEAVEEEKKAKNLVINLEDIVVKGEVFSQQQSAYSITRIGSKEIEDMNISRTADILSSVPGIKITEYNQGGISNAVTMRGFSSGVHGGDMGVYLDGIPLNEYYGHGGGYADPNVVIPIEIDRVMVYRGPSSALYGNFSRAGTVAFYSKKKGEYDALSMKYGSFQTFDTQASLGTQLSENLWNNTAVQVYRTGGYTENSEHLLGNASTRFTCDVTNDLELSVSLRAHAADWEAPGYISRDQWEDEEGRFDQDPAIGNDGGERQQFSERLDAAYTVNNNMKLLFWGFALQSEWIRWADFGGGQSERNYEIAKYGAGMNANYKNDNVNAIGGIEFYRDDTDYEQFPTAERVKTGALTKDTRTKFDNYAVFAEGEIDLIQYFKPTAGVRVDVFTGEEKDYLNDTERDFSVEDYWHASPKVGFISTLVKDVLDLRFNVSNGFIMPPAEALHENKDVDPAEIWQYEAGITITYQEYAWFDVAAYVMDTKNEVQEIPSGSGEYRNYGETRRKGVEAAVKLNPVKMLEIAGNYSYTDTEITKNEDSSLEGKSITSIPEMKADASVKGITPFGIYGMVEWTYVGDWYVDKANDDTYNGHNIFDAAVGYTVDSGDQKVDVKFEVKNILNEHYATFASGSMWATGAPRSYWVSANIKW